jgi:hypothetical protein
VSHEQRVRTGVSNIAKLFDLGERASDTVRPAFTKAPRVFGVPSGGYSGTGELPFIDSMFVRVASG